MNKPTIIWRHKKENLKKCSLTGLENRKDLYFATTLPSFPIKDYILLSLGGPALSQEEQDKGLFLIDATWKYAYQMMEKLPSIEQRSIPIGFKTAYPRKQTLCPDPEVGLASVEALFIACWITGRPTDGLLDHYYWKNSFLSINRHLF